MKRKGYKIGDIVWVKLRGDGAHVQSGTRPAVIVQNNIGNRFSPTISVAPITSANKTKLPTHVSVPAGVGSLSKNSLVQCEGIRPVSKADILGCIGVMPEVYMAKISIAQIINTPLIKYLTQAEINSIYNEVSLQ